jgi:hypothetical protein
MTVEVSAVRNRLRRAIEQAREQSQQRKQRAAEAERAYQTFLDQVATPLARQVANALKAEGYHFTVFTPGGGLRLASDRGRDDYIEFALDADAAQPEVIARISRSRGSRTLEEERPVKAGASPETISDDDLLLFLLAALEPWLSVS